MVMDVVFVWYYFVYVYNEFVSGDCFGGYDVCSMVSL